MFNQLKQFGKVKADEPMSKHITMKVGGRAKFFIEIDNVGKMAELLKFLDGAGEEYRILGGGSNLIFSDDFFNGTIIKFTAKNLEIDGDLIIAEAGIPTVTVARESVSAGLTGFEWGVGVPGSLGGAVRGNAGAMGGDMAGAVEKLLVYSDGEVAEWSREDCDFSYRESIFKHSPAVVLKVWLRLHKGEEGANKMQKAIEAIQYRNKTQPQGYASSGCIFKNPILDKEKLGERVQDLPEEFLTRDTIPAGWLIENVGLKGHKEGNAMISDVHGNFIVNLGEAKAEDVVALKELAKTKVFDEWGIELEEEVSFL